MDIFEEVSILKLIEQLAFNIQKNYYSWNLNFKLGEDSIIKAVKITGKISSEVMIKNLYELYECNIQKQIDITEQEYYGVMEVLFNVVDNEKLHWRYRRLALIFIKQLTSRNIRFKIQWTRTILNNLLNDNVYIRFISTKCFLLLLKQVKPCKKKTEVSPEEFLGQGIATNGYGERDANDICKYKGSNNKTIEEIWEKLFFKENYIGYSSWPRKIEVYHVIEEEEKNSWEKEISTFFNEPENVKKLINYWKIEDQVCPKSFNKLNTSCFKCLFQVCGLELIQIFIEILGPLFKDSQERSQVLGSEILAGVITGTKYWPLSKQNLIQKDLILCIRQALQYYPNDKLKEWEHFINFITIKTHPNRIFWMYEMIINNLEFSSTENSKFLMSKLFTMGNMMKRHEWQLEEFNQKLLKKLEPKLSDHYEMISEGIAGVLAHIFAPDISPELVLPTKSPHIEDFISFALLRLELKLDEADGRKRTLCLLYDENVERDGTLESKEEWVINHSNLRDYTRNDAINLLKTVAQWVIVTSTSSSYFHPKLYQFLPYFFYMESQGSDVELSSLFIKAISSMSKLVVLSQNFDVILEPFLICKESSFWMVRLRFLEFLQPFIFHNLAVLMNENSRAKVVDIVLKFLEDERSEVRQKSSEVLSGLIHCNLVGNIWSTLVKFESLCLRDRTSEAKIELQQRHAGVLGLCSFISANPYSLPEYLPKIFKILSSQNYGNPIIKDTIKQTVENFMRTHSTEKDVLHAELGSEIHEILEELSVPSSYYA